MAYDVFISYSSQDVEIAEAAYSALKNAGVQCWMDHHSILPGEGHGGAIIRGISASRVMLLILSANSNGSPDVLREVERAAGKRLRIVPWRIEELDLSDDFQYFISYGQRLDALTRPIESHLDRLVASIKHYLPDESSPVAETSIDGTTIPTAMVSDASPPPESADEAPAEEAGSARKTNRDEFLAQCDEHDRKFFSELLAYCAANHRKIIIDWGGRGFSLKDAKQRPLIWMFPTRNEWSIQIRTPKFTRQEVEKVKAILYDNRITGNSWKPRDLGLEPTQAIIDLLCRVAPAKTVEPLPQETVASSQAMETDVADAGRKISRDEFLAQCDEQDVKRMLHKPDADTPPPIDPKPPISPPLVAISSPKEIAKALKQVTRALTHGSRRFEVMVGLPGPGAEPKVVQWRPTEEIWSLAWADSEQGHFRFGSQSPKECKRLTVECEIVVPLQGVNDPAEFNDGGLFVRDESGTIFLAHTGEIGGGDLGVTKEFIDSHLGPWHDVSGAGSDTQTKNQVLCIGALDDPQLAAKVAAFVRQVSAFFSERELGPAGALDPGNTADYSPDELQAVLWQSMAFTWYEREDAVRLATHALGYKRMGSKIQDAFKSVIRNGLRRKMFEAAGSQIRKLKY